MGEIECGEKPAEEISGWKSLKSNAMKRLRGKSQSTSLQDGPRVVTGPVIGKVTDTSARILLEIDVAAKISMILESESNKLELTKNLPALRPKVFEFKDLVPNTLYKLKLHGCNDLVPFSSFSTFPCEPREEVNVAVVSCNKIFVTEEYGAGRSDLWAHLASRVEQRKVHMILHLGDQIYGDGDKAIDKNVGSRHDQWSNRFKLSEELLKDVPREEWASKQELICEKYREVYRKTWGYIPTAKCLANCPNFMIYDDHEIRDNWADLADDYKEDTLDFFIARCAWITNLEYQKQLYEDVDFNNLSAIDGDYHFHVVGGIGLMFIDIRGPRSFHRKDGDEKIYLGSKQWEDVHKSLAPEGCFGQVHALLVCSPAPLVFLEPTITNKVANVPRLVDFKGHWSAEKHHKEQIEMIDSLDQWKRHSKNRDVLVLGGDVHCGGHSIIMKEDSPVLRQLTTSAISNRPLPKTAYYFMRLAGQLGRLHPGHYSFKHHHWTRSRNYALLQIKHNKAEDKTCVEISAELVIGSRVKGITRGTKFVQYEETKSMCTGLRQFYRHLYFCLTNPTSKKSDL